MVLSYTSSVSRIMAQMMLPVALRSGTKTVVPISPRYLSLRSSSVNVNIGRGRDALGGRIGQRYVRFSSATNTAQTDKSKEEKESGESLDEAKNEAEGDSEVEKKLREELNRAVSESAAHLSKSRDFEDKYKRALAETENLRARLTKQIKDAKLYAVQGFCKDMTEISDILRMAVDSVPKEQISDSNPHLKNLYDGLNMTESRLLQVFKSHGLVQINPLDEKFNPNEHEAVVQQEVEGKESGTIVFVSKLGYKLHDRVIRPAVVGVAK